MMIDEDILRCLERGMCIPGAIAKVEKHDGKDVLTIIAGGKRLSTILDKKFEDDIPLAMAICRQSLYSLFINLSEKEMNNIKDILNG